MATNGRGNKGRQQGKPKPTGKPKPVSTATGPPPERTAVGAGPAGSAIRRQSVATDRPAETNRTQIIIIGCAVVVMAFVVVLGLVWNRSNTEVKNDGYGNSKSSVATLDSGVITISNGAPTLAIDVYEDPICPACGNFERQYGQQIAQAVDEGKLTVHYHLLTFLDSGSASKDYSTRAAAALMCAASNLGSTPGAFAALHSSLFSEAVQPAEGGSADLTNDQLLAQVRTAATAVNVATDAAAVTATATCITDGTELPTVASSFATSTATLTALTGGVQSPVVVHNGAVVGVDSGSWLTDLLAG